MACAANCTGGCQGSCYSSSTCWCGSNCQACGGGCSYGCGGCDGSCSGSCTGSCNTGCKNECENACNTGCTSTESTRLAGIALNTKMLASNITDIARLIYLEAQRRGKQPSSTSFTSGSKLNPSEITKLINNLVLSEKTVSYQAISGSSANKNLGQDLIDKAIEAYNTLIGIA